MISKRKVTTNRKFWQMFFSKAHRRRTTEEWQTASNLAAGWNTCACGSINDGLERYTNDSPVDLELSCLGTDFYCAVNEKQLNLSRALFNQIQVRAGILLHKRFRLERWL